MKGTAENHSMCLNQNISFTKIAMWVLLLFLSFLITLTIGTTAATAVTIITTAKNDTYNSWTTRPIDVPPAGVLSNDIDASVNLTECNPVVSHRSPNVVLIFVDDLGFADTGYHNKYYKETISDAVLTPNIDSIASNGVWFSSGYVTAPVCGPSRAGLMTGRYQNRFGFEDNPGPYKTIVGEIGVPTSEIMLPERLKEIGYSTGMIGKWHGGKTIEFYPSQRGFDEVFGFNNGAQSYFIGYNDQTEKVTDTNGVEHIITTNPLYRDEFPVEREDEYITDAYGREAVAFIDRHHQEPFFLYLSFNAVHGPMQFKPEDTNQFAHVADEARRECLAMNYCLDENIGKVLSALNKYGLEEDTLIIFLSDNGGKPSGNYSYNDPLRGQKGELWEGGIRIPFCIQWKGHIPAGTRKDFQIISLDILPTIIDAARGNIPPEDEVDGVSLLPFIAGDSKGEPHDFLYWRFNTKWVVRDSRWKLINPNINSGAPPQLYDLLRDMSETTDIANDFPEKAELLLTKYTNWTNSLMPKLWGWNSSFPYYDPFFNESAISNAVTAPILSEEWIASNTWMFGTGIDINADEDGDRYPNLFEFASGSDWLLSNRIPSRAVLGTSAEFPELSEFTFKRRKDYRDYFLDFFVESSSKPSENISWNTIGWTKVKTTEVGDGTNEFVTYRYFCPIEGRFVRQRIVTP